MALGMFELPLHARVFFFTYCTNKFTRMHAWFLFLSSACKRRLCRLG